MNPSAQLENNRDNENMCLLLICVNQFFKHPLMISLYKHKTPRSPQHLPYLLLGVSRHGDIVHSKVERHVDLS